MTKLSGLAKQLIRAELLSEESAIFAIEMASKQNTSFVRYLVKKELVEAKTLAMTISHEYGLPYFDLTTYNLENVPQVNLKSTAIENGHAMTIFKRGSHLFIAISDPTNLQALDEIKFQTGIRPEAIIVEDHVLEIMFNRAQELSNSAFSEIEDEELENLDIASVENDVYAQDEESHVDEAPIVRFVNKMLLDAINSNASDIHFEPYEKTYRVRFRQDGVLHEHANPPINLATRISSRLKVMSLLDISEKRIPQDGRFKMRLSKHREIDFRVSSCPTSFGEKIVMRILDPSSTNLGIDALGYDSKQKDIFLKNLQKPQGMILVTGPTGSGKTVSLYTALSILNTEERNISSAEDPIEINLPGINQVNVNPKAGLTFATALRSFLRQDPDVVMVGEIRDVETAEIAVKAAQTGHIVLSTLHTNSAADTITRLINMGIPAYNLATSLNLIIAQRLVRKLCINCRVKADIPAQTLLQMRFTQKEIDSGELTIYKPVGCQQCEKGYKGRIGIYEVMNISKEMSNLIMEEANAIQLRAQAKKEHVWELYDAGLSKVRQGITSLEEVFRVTTD